MSNTEKLKGTDLSRDIFGGVLDYDGAGHYPGLELLNLVFSTESSQILPSEPLIALRRRAHDFARRLVWDESFQDNDSKRAVLYDTETEEAIKQLLSCLQLPIPSLNKAPGWERAHFFPFTESLIHWDARKRGGKIKIERRYLRGGGALAFHVLRKDKQRERLAKIRTGFVDLFSDSKDSALEKLASTLLSKGFQDQNAVTDHIEASSSLRHDEQEELFRNGVLNILEHKELSSVSRIKSIMTWTAFWLVITQNIRATEFLNIPVNSIICDCGSSHPQLKRASQRCLDSVEKASENGSISKQQKNKVRGFFWATAATINLLNAWRGRRHFTLGLELIETLVLAATSGSSEISFEYFVDDWLYQKCNLVVGRAAAERSGKLNFFDSSVFEDNENHLALQMKAAGLLTEYSDATRMVGTGGLL
jgi:hypothetical protein